MKITCHGTGSKGNCIYVEFESGACVYLDAGISLKKINTPKANAYVLITHEHKDHASQALKWLTDYGARIVCSKGTGNAIGLSRRDFTVCMMVDELTPETAYRVMEHSESQKNNMYVMGIHTQHDAREPSAFVIFSGKESLFYCVDSSVIPNTNRYPFDVAIIEANYTKGRLEKSLENEDNAAYVSGRVQGIFGHIGLDDVEKYVAEQMFNTTPRVLLAHMSSRNFDVSEYLLKTKEFIERTDLLIAGQTYKF